MSIAERLAAVRARMDAACARAGRAPSSCTLIAVSKTQPPEKLREAHDAGQRVFGENYVQELTSKLDAVPGAAWHFIGKLQRNKAKDLVGRVALIHTVDSVPLAEALHRRAHAIQDVLIEINIAAEPQKAGISPAELPALLEKLTPFTSIRVRGLMAIPPPQRTIAPIFGP